MPILDGYRATHLIRHHDPFYSLPGLSTVPIVAMTASAIQGDKEKCERAGMDDYLAKPVKAKALEKMLVKWAFQQKRNPQGQKTSGSQYTDHDSSCADLESILPPGKVDESPLKSVEANENNDHAREIAHKARLPGIESEGERGLRRVEAEEKAISLRDDKLLIAANESYPDHPGGGSQGSHSVLPRPELSATALTQENVEKLGREQDNASSTSRIQPLSVGRGGNSHSNVAVNGEEQSQSKKERGSLSSSSRKGAKGSLNRNESGWSQQTIKAQRSMDIS